MNRVLRIALVAALLVALPSIALAQAQQGDKEVQLSGNLFMSTSSGSTFAVGQFQPRPGKP